jgi:hypothetical protein
VIGTPNATGQLDAKSLDGAKRAKKQSVERARCAPRPSRTRTSTIRTPSRVFAMNRLIWKKNRWGTCDSAKREEAGAMTFRNA